MPALLLENVSKTFGHGDTAVHAVDGVTLEVAAGEVLLVMGPSGSGKTTLLAIAGCLLKPDSGRVSVDGRDVTALGQGALPEVRRKHLGFIFQSFNLLGALTARENVELPMELAGLARDREQVSNLMNDLGIAKRAGALPAALSGGERQRVAIARALATNPSVILADEPTANLDSRSGHQVAELLSQAARQRGKAVVIVSHDARLMEIADRVVWMEDGRISAKGVT